MSLRASTSAADVRLERKIRYEYAKITVKGRLRTRPVHYTPASQHESAEATSVTASSCQDLYVSSIITATTGG